MIARDVMKRTYWSTAQKLLISSEAWGHMPLAMDKYYANLDAQYIKAIIIIQRFVRRKCNFAGLYRRSMRNIDVTENLRLMVKKDWKKEFIQQKDREQEVEAQRLKKELDDAFTRQASAIGSPAERSIVMRPMTAPAQTTLSSRGRVMASERNRYRDGSSKPTKRHNISETESSMENENSHMVALAVLALSETVDSKGGSEQNEIEFFHSATQSDQPSLLTTLLRNYLIWLQLESQILWNLLLKCLQNPVTGVMIQLSLLQVCSVRSSRQLNMDTYLQVVCQL